MGLSRIDVVVGPGVLVEKEEFLDDDVRVVEKDLSESVGNLVTVEELGIDEKDGNKNQGGKRS